MSIWRTLGGGRLGSGKKQMVELHGYERSTHNLNTALRTTASAGTLIPFLCAVALPGDTWDIELDCDIQTLPTVGALFGSFKVELSLFQAPFRLYNARLHNNELNIGRKMQEVKLPQIKLKAYEETRDLNEIVNLDNLQINPSNVLSYLGQVGIGINPDDTAVYREFNITAWLMLWDIYKYYYANKQEEKGAVIHTPITANIETVDDIEAQTAGGTVTIPQLPTTTPATIFPGAGLVINYTPPATPPDPSQIYFMIDGFGAIQATELASAVGWVVGGAGAGTITASYNGKFGYATISAWRYRTEQDTIMIPPQVTLFNLANIDEMRRLILKHDNTPFIVNDEAPALEPYSFMFDETFNSAVLRQSQEGLPVKTYLSDLLNNWVSIAWMDEITEATRVDTTGGSFSIENLILQKKLYNQYMRVAVSGGTYNDWLEVSYDIERLRITESPIYEGGLIKELVFQEVISNSASDSGQPLGTLAGRGVMGNKHKGGDIIIKTEEHSMILGFFSLTPRIDNSQGNEWFVHLKTMDDFHVSSLDGIGFQDLSTEQMAWWDVRWDVTDAEWKTKSAGKQPAWINYQTNINRTKGNFAIQTNQMYMTLNRRYEADIDSIKDLTTYIDSANM